MKKSHSVSSSLESTRLQELQRPRRNSVNSYRQFLIVVLGLLVLSCASDSVAREQRFETRGLFPILKDGKWGFMDKTGAIKIKPQFDATMLDWGGCPVSNFTDGLNVVKVGDKFGYINEHGNFEINPQFDFAGPFSEGMAMVTISGKTGFIDKTGRILVAPHSMANFQVYGVVATFVTERTLVTHLRAL